VAYALLLIIELKNAHIDAQFQKIEMYNDYIKDIILLNSKVSILKKLKLIQRLEIKFYQVNLTI